MSLSYLMKASADKIVPMIMLGKGTSNLIANCELKGKSQFATAGIVMSKCDAILKDNKLDGFNKGAIMCWLKESNICKIFTTQIRGCDHAGIQCMGNSASPLIEFCIIENNKCPGIQVCTGNRCQIRKNTIIGNNEGIEVISGDPQIFKNVIAKNQTTGIVTCAVEDLICQPRIWCNNINSNRNYGILCSGFNNLTRIEENSNISFNKLAGIKVENEAEPIVLKNKIFKNINQGILVSENSSAHIENNIISENIKANIAMGGDNSANNVVVKNEIFGGRCEGIFVIEGGYSLIFKNKIYDNYDGIVCCTAIPQILKNIVKKNRRHGIVV
jgi:F-box protein 11